jgi:hypothetical protein
MPNHCHNQLKLSSGGDIQNVINPYLIFRGAGDYDFDFQRVIPMDEKLLEGEDWYMWRVGNWGTKWEGYCGRFNDDGTVFTFETAWSPPGPIIKELAKLTGETFILQYIEEGNFFCGQLTAGATGEFDDKYYNDITSAPEELKESLGYVPWEEEESSEEAPTKDLKIESFSCVGVTQIIPKAWEDWIWTALNDGAPFSWGDNNHSLVEAAGFGEHLDKVLKSTESDFQDTIKEHRPAITDTLSYLHANKIYIDLER